MWLLLFVLLGMGNCFIITLIFSLMGAGRRADEGEEKILDIMLSGLPDEGDNISAQAQHASPSSKAVAVK